MEEGVDFYFNEQGLMVLTATYLLERGYCCQNKCTNCPWNYGKENSQQSSESIHNQTLNQNDSIKEGDNDLKI
jgi:hypothetical protein